MRQLLNHLPKQVAKTMLGYYRRQRFYELLRALALPLLCYGVLGLIAMHLDRLMFLEQSTRISISWLTHGLGILTGAIGLALFAWRKRPVSGLAYDLERMLPKATAERLVTLNDILAGASPAQLQMAGGTVRASLVAQLTQETVAICEGTPHAARLVRDPGLKRRFMALALLGLIWAVLYALPSYQFPLMWQRLTWPNQNLPKPSFTKLTVTPEAPMVGKGGEVVLLVRVEAGIPDWLRTPMRWLGADAGVSLLATEPGEVDQLPITSAARPMSRVQSRLFVSSLSNLQESFSFRVRCGDAQTDIRFAKVVAQPRATNVQVEVISPEYTHVKPARYTDLRDAIPAFPSSKVTLTFSSDQTPLKASRLVNMADGTTIAELSADSKSGQYVHRFEMAAPLEMEIVLINQLDFENTERVRVTMTLREDQPPSVRLEYPAGEITVAEGDVVPLQGEALDDIELLEGYICIQSNADQDAAAPIRQINLDFEKGQLLQSLTPALDLEKLGAEPGDLVRVWFLVRDTGNNDEVSQSVLIRVTAFGGNDNERRRLAALGFVARALQTTEPTGKSRKVLSLDETKYEPIANAAHADGLLLDRRPMPESLLSFLEREQHFTDSPAAATEVRLLHGVIAALYFLPPTPPQKDVESQNEALHKLATELFPPLMCERLGRDLIRRALNLRIEIQATISSPKPGVRKNASTQSRRVTLLKEAIDMVGADMVGLTRISPLFNEKREELLEFNRQLSRSCRGLNEGGDSSRERSTGDDMCKQIDGWIQLLLPLLPTWKTQRLEARVILNREFDRLWGTLKKGPRNAVATRWLSADIRMLERSPFACLADRNGNLGPSGQAPSPDASTKAALAGESTLFSNMAVESSFAQWMESPRITPTEQRLAAVLKAMDLTEDPNSLAKSAERLRALNLRDDEAVGPDTTKAPASRGFYTHLPALTKAGTTLPMPHLEALDEMVKQTAALQNILGQYGEPANPEDTDTRPRASVAGVIDQLETGLAQWEADVLALTCRMHLDLSYGDPRRKETAHLAATLPKVRNTLERYQSIVSPMFDLIRDRLRQGNSEKSQTILESELKSLSLRVRSLAKNLEQAKKLLLGEAPIGRENGSVHEARAYYTAARILGETQDPIEAAKAFFAAQPQAGAIVLDQRMPLLRELMQRIKEAEEALRTGDATAAPFREAIDRAARIASEFEQLLNRFAALDPDGAVRALASDINRRSKLLANPERKADAASLPRDRLAVDQLRKQAEQYEGLTQDLIARNTALSFDGWWGGPEGIWEGAGRRDAEHTRSRLLGQFNRARRATVMGFDAILSLGKEAGQALPDAPLANALFAWRALHSSIGGASFHTIREKVGDPKEELAKWLIKEAEKAKKIASQPGGLKTFRKETGTMADSAIGFFSTGRMEHRK